MYTGIIALESTTLADKVESMLLTYIRQNKLVPGDSLPKEEELAERLHVSRQIVREGVSRLKALELVESRKKRGMIIKSPCVLTGIRKIAEADLFSSRDWKELMEMRIALELGMCDMIYTRKTPDQLAGLMAASGIPDSSMQPFEIEIEFHVKLMEITGNRVASQLRQILSRALRPIYPKELLPYKVANSPTHCEICKVLEAGSMEEFHSILREHFQPYLKMFDSR